MSVRTRTREAPKTGSPDLPPAPVLDLPPAPPELPEAPPAPPPPPPIPTRPRRAWPLAWAALAIAVIVAVIAAVLITRSDEPAVSPGEEVIPAEEPAVEPDGGIVPEGDGSAVVPTPAAPTLINASADSAVIRWVSAGPEVDGYRILRNGQVAGDVGAGVRRFEDSGLLPDTTYRYSVLATSAGATSPASPPLVVRTERGTLASATVAGSWKVKLVIQSAYNFPSLSSGTRYSGFWDLRETARGVKMSGDLFGGGYVSVPLRGNGPAYRGSTREQLSQCGMTPVTDTVDIVLRVTRGATRGGAWRAVALEGTVEDFSPSASWGAMYCADSGYTASFTARPV